MNPETKRSVQPTVVLAGGNGFLGRGLTQPLTARGFRVIVLTRSWPESGLMDSPLLTKEGLGEVGGREEGSWDVGSGEMPPVKEDNLRTKIASGDVLRHVAWDGKTVGDWTKYLDGAATVVNFTGRSVNCRHTEKNRREIIESRTLSVRAIGEAIRSCSQPPKVWIQAGSLAIYGDAGERICDEEAPHGNDFSTEVCRLWEEAFQSAVIPGTRKILLRIGLVLGPDGGFLQPLANLTRLFLGGTVGSGKQYISWLHTDDFNRMVLRAIEDPAMAGVFNATGPNPVTNAELMRELRHVLNRPWLPPTPTWAVHIGAWLMRTEASLALTGRRCIPRRLIETGFEFQFPELRGALENIAPG